MIVHDQHTAKGINSHSNSPGERGERLGAVADGFYHSFRNDTAIMKQLGVKHMRLSIAWPRIIPQGTGEVNQAGLAFYNRVVDALLEAGIEPHVTLYHWDLPQVRPPLNPTSSTGSFYSII